LDQLLNCLNIFNYAEMIQVQHHAHPHRTIWENNQQWTYSWGPWSPVTRQV